MNRYNTVIFDFDYTLADSSRGAVECINYAMHRLGLDKVSDEIARRTIGLSLRDTFASLAGEECSISPDCFSTLFVERADEVMADLTEVFERVPEVVRSLKRLGKKTGIVSTKFRYRIENILKREGLLDLFDVIIGGEDVAEHKPDPTGLLRAVDLAGGHRDSAIYVGDSITDAKTAMNAGVAFIAMLTGVTKTEEFADYNALKCVGDMGSLYDCLVGR